MRKCTRGTERERKTDREMDRQKQKYNFIAGRVQASGMCICGAGQLIHPPPSSLWLFKYSINSM